MYHTRSSSRELKPSFGARSTQVLWQRSRIACHEFGAVPRGIPKPLGKVEPAFLLLKKLLIDATPRAQKEPQSPWLTVHEVAWYLSVSAGTVRNWVSQRYIPFARRGRVVRFHREKIDQWLAAGSCKGRLTVSGN